MSLLCPSAIPTYTVLYIPPVSGVRAASSYSCKPHGALWLPRCTLIYRMSHYLSVYTVTGTAYYIEKVCVLSVLDSLNYTTLKVLYLRTNHVSFAINKAIIALNRRCFPFLAPGGLCTDPYNQGRTTANGPFASLLFVHSGAVYPSAIYLRAPSLCVSPFGGRDSGDPIIFKQNPEEHSTQSRLHGFG